MYDEKKPPASERNLPILGRSGIEPLLDSHKQRQCSTCIPALCSGWSSEARSQVSR